MFASSLPYLFRYSAVLVAAFALNLVGAATAAEPVFVAQPDEVGLLSVWPKNIPAAAADKALPLSVRVSFNQNAADTATVHLEADFTQAGQFTAVTSTQVKRGRGNAELRTFVSPPPGGFKHPVKLRARLELLSGDLLSNSRTIIFGELQPHHVDSILIKGCEPESLIIGQEQEVAVLVSYRLVTSERGEINLGFNDLAPSGHGISSSKQIEKGEGEVVITARVTPRSWGDNVLFQAFVNLSEFPHTREWSPFALDSEPLELRTP